MTKRGYRVKGWIYVMGGVASAVMLVTGVLDWPIATAQTVVLPVLAWMNFAQAKRVRVNHGS